MWPFKRKVIQREKKSSVLGLDDTLSKLLLLSEDNGSSPGSALSLYRKSSSVSIPINKIADSFSTITPVLRIDGKIERSHPLLELLYRPSPHYDGTLFLETLAKYYLTTNELSVIALGNINSPPLELQPISPANISIPHCKQGAAYTINVTGETLTGTYTLDLRKQRARYLQGGLRELKFIRGFSTRDNSLLRGESLLVSVSKEVRQHILGTKHNVSLLEKGGRVSLVFNFQDDLYGEDFEELKNSIKSQYSGAENAGEIGVTAGSKLDIKEIGTNNKDMDFAKLHDMAKLSVAMQYKVPIVLITTDAATFNNYEKATLALWDDAVLPLADRIFSGLGNFLMPRYGLDPRKVELTYDIDNITALAMRRNEELKLRKELSIETDNELRGMIGREPYDGGDAIYKPANLVPVGRDLLTTDDDPKVLSDEE